MRLLILMVCMMLATPLFAVEPDEILDDPVLEQRAREISKGLRCLVCRNENIDSSHADIARDLRLLVRERLLVGETDEQVVDYIVDRYGEFVLLKPQFSLSNALLYLMGPVLLLLGGVLVLIYVRGRNRAESNKDTLSAEESDRVAELMRD